MESNNAINFSQFISTAIIFVEVHWSNVEGKIKEYIKTICCTNNPKYCDSCLYCQKINANTYYDYLSFNCYKSWVKKESIMNVKNVFSYTALESIQNKFCVIYGIEKLSKFVYNSLLKILEDPPKHTFFIFTTRNIQAIPSTIRSRCQLLRLVPEKEKINLLLDNNLVTTSDLDNIFNTFFSLEDAQEAIDNGDFQLIKETSKNILLSITDLVLQRNILSEFKKMTYFQIEKIFSFLLPKINLKVKVEYLELMSYFNLNLNKTLIFNKLLFFLKS